MSGGHLISSWESPSDSRHIPKGYVWIPICFNCEKNVGIPNQASSSLCLTERPYHDSFEQFHSFSQKLRCTAMVVSVSPSCEKIAPTKPSSSVVNWHAMVFARAVMAAVSSQGFMSLHLTAMLCGVEFC